MPKPDYIKIWLNDEVKMSRLVKLKNKLYHNTFSGMQTASNRVKQEPGRPTQSTQFNPI